jgi:phosphate transport system protein
MREEFQADLTEVSRLLVTMAEAVRAALRKATSALLTADIEAARVVMERDAEVDAIYAQVESKVADTIARQAPVASDLRMVITALHISADLERMGDLAEHVAKTAQRRHPSPAVPAELRPVFQQMAAVADLMADQIITLLGKPDAELAARLEKDDDSMDELERQLFKVLLHDDWPYGAETAIDGALLGRFYERYADHAVNIGEQMIYLITGEPVAGRNCRAVGAPRGRPDGPFTGPGSRPRPRLPWPPRGRGRVRPPWSAAGSRRGRSAAGSRSGC